MELILLSPVFPFVVPPPAQDPMHRASLTISRRESNADFVYLQVAIAALPESIGTVSVLFFSGEYEESRKSDFLTNWSALSSYSF